MIESIIIILAILFVSKKVENKLKIPNPLTILALTFAILAVNPNFLNFIDVGFFSEEMTVFIVILVLLDAFILRFEDLKKNFWSIFYLAIVAVVLSILAGAFLLDYTIFGKYNLEIGAVIALFAMTLATDPVAVVATFKQYEVPHRVKFLAEGESLFNDAMALIMFSFFGLYMLQGGEVTTGYSAEVVFKVFLGSTLIGLAVGMVGMVLVRVIKDIMVELVAVLLIAYTAFYIAEHAHLSGLLAEIVAVLTLTTILEKAYKRYSEESEKIKDRLTQPGAKVKASKIDKLMQKLMLDMEYMNSQKDIVLFLGIITMFVNVFLFVSLGKIINFENILRYWKEIATMFLLTTAIRMVMMGKFAIIATKAKITCVDVKSWFLLTFAGIKGGLSIVMLHWLHDKVPNFQHMDLFVAVVTGVILLSMFIYTIGLILTISLNKESFLEEVEREKEHHYLD